ncbi:uncharacterized protein N7483_011957 [Penicillium malachiteum]|uniref:uncharacterized protein n=1 Tax=Penicillium malachiteum TaxID=1324776 RepID=UPI0025468B61|nr:uncharacterized protein N7483_011957 [Penicillium malachiteum]KAJ5714776.1 hypothetical protein N7483_011957 [Penicillium malachiteum]
MELKTENEKALPMTPEFEDTTESHHHSQLFVDASQRQHSPFSQSNSDLSGLGIESQLPSPQPGNSPQHGNAFSRLKPPDVMPTETNASETEDWEIHGQ